MELLFQLEGLEAGVGLPATTSRAAIRTCKIFLKIKNLGLKMLKKDEKRAFDNKVERVLCDNFRKCDKML